MESNIQIEIKVKKPKTQEEEIKGKDINMKQFIENNVKEITWRMLKEMNKDT